MPRPTQFGISEDEVDDVIEAALAMPNIHLDGFHFHSISNNLDSNLHLEIETFSNEYGLSL